MTLHLVTSGCSFSENSFEPENKKWPRHLSEYLNAKLYNWGHPSSGNDWISRSTIYQLYRLLESGINPKKIIVAVMWSGLDRKSLFISSRETDNYASLINHDNLAAANPVNFIGNDSMNHRTSSTIDGYLVGSMNCDFNNSNIGLMKREFISKFCTDESLAIESYEHFLRLQWFCKSKNIKLINQTYMNILQYPDYKTDELLTKDKFRNVAPLHNMIDFSKWIFWNEFDGLYEYTKDNNLNFQPDGCHPAGSANKFYVDNYLMPEIQRRNLV